MIVTRATIEVALSADFFVWMIGLLNPKKSSDSRYCVAIASIGYSGHGIIHRAALLFSFKICFWVTF